MTEVQREKNAFFGMSTLREQEKAARGPTEKAKELEKYLASKYATTGSGWCSGVVPITKVLPSLHQQTASLAEDTKRKRKKKKAAAAQAGVQIHDLDNTGFYDGTAAVTRPTSRRHGRPRNDNEDEEEGVQGSLYVCQDIVYQLNCCNECQAWSCWLQMRLSSPILERLCVYSRLQRRWACIAFVHCCTPVQVLGPSR